MTQETSKEETHDSIPLNVLINVDKVPLILLNSSTSIEFVNTSDILYLEAAGVNTFVYTSNRKFISGKNLARFSFITDFKNFIRVTRTYIINADKIAKIANRNKGVGRDVVMSNGNIIELKSGIRNHELNNFLKSAYYFV